VATVPCQQPHILGCRMLSQARCRATDNTTARFNSSHTCGLVKEDNHLTTTQDTSAGWDAQGWTTTGCCAVAWRPAAAACWPGQPQAGSKASDPCLSQQHDMPAGWRKGCQGQLCTCSSLHSGGTSCAMAACHNGRANLASPNSTGATLPHLWC
jgi:hypothetical protein